MGIAQIAYRSLNRVLSSAGWYLAPISLDFEQYPMNENIQQALFCELAASAREWLKRQNCFEATSFDITGAVCGKTNAHLLRRSFGSSTPAAGSPPKEYRAGIVRR